MPPALVRATRECLPATCGERWSASMPPSTKQDVSLLLQSSVRKKHKIATELAPKPAPQTIPDLSNTVAPCGQHDSSKTRKNVVSTKRVLPARALQKGPES